MTNRSRNLTIPTHLYINDEQIIKQFPVGNVGK